MAAKLSGGGGGKYQVEQNSEINVTPFVDIMLVLLIIFMVAAPLAAPSVDVTLPRAVAPLAPNPPKPIYISITGDGQAYLGDYALGLDQIGSELQAQIGRRNPADERIFIRADKSVRYGDFMQVMNSLQDNGFYSVALVGEDTDRQ
ncbi:biopolymer transporter ExbD [uncultured Brevundimonas sp.]|uniref:ExbD/TolR family protein n=1 Tax=uncultured Brevundimonas sp. TaxID=213418 RepID=UPI00262A9B3C|nr:biopolymer transporter ExbD [uncultured Brevundimonas sp.]HRJ65325.1 biopolymer transporter ExbD [Brevundimonas sp.]